MTEKQSYSTSLAIQGLNWLIKKGDESEVERLNKETRAVTQERVALEDLGVACSDRGNCLVTGGNSATRIRILQSCCKASLVNGRIPVVIHASDTDMLDAFYQSNLPVPYLGTKVQPYDPFRGYTNDEIAMSVVSSSVGTGEEYRVNQNALPYLFALLRLIRCRGEEPSFQKLSTAPHSSMGRIVTESVNYGSLSPSDAEDIRSLLSMSEGHQYGVVFFLNEMARTSQGILASGNGASGISIKQATSHPCIVTVNIGSYRNKLLLGAVISEITSLWGQRPFSIILDDPIGLSKGRLWDLASNAGGNHLMSVVTRDVVASIDGDERSLKALSALCPFQIVMAHGSDSSNSMVSKMMGEYEMTELKESYGTQSYRQSLLSFPGYGTNKSYVKEKRTVPRVKPEEIRGLRPNEAFVVTGDSVIHKVRF